MKAMGGTDNDGGLDELRLWNVLRTASQVQASRSAELTGTETGLVAYWRFNEGVGLSVADDSPGSAAAVLMNGTAWAVDGPGARHHGTANRERGGIEPVLLERHDHVHDERGGDRLGHLHGRHGLPVRRRVQRRRRHFSCRHAHRLSLRTRPISSGAKASDGANNLQVGSPLTFRTLGDPRRAGAARWAIVTPAAGTVGGSISITATASDARRGRWSRSSSMAGRWARRTPRRRTPWDDSGTIGDGPHTLTAEARDAANNVATASVAVVVHNTPGPYHTMSSMA